MQLNGRRGLTNPDIENLHEHGKAHRKVDVALGNVLPEAVRDERNADEQEETQSQHFHGPQIR